MAVVVVITSRYQPAGQQGTVECTPMAQAQKGTLLYLVSYPRGVLDVFVPKTRKPADPCDGRSLVC